MNVFEEFNRRGLIAQTTNAEKIEEALKTRRVTFYTGFDATADSLHVGHFFQLLMMRRLQMAGHRPIVLLGTGTTMIGDPTGKTDMRKMLTVEEINHNAERFKEQMSRFIDFSEGEAIMLKNGDWLMDLNYIQLLRDVGVHFSVNRMLAAECFKSRMEKGLSFLEFNYMIMQSYDFLHQFRHYDCMMQMGGDDQWANILGGVELVRKVTGEEVYGMTYKLLTTKEGKKMGKTEKGAVWLDAQKTTPYEFFQYWRNVDDGDVLSCLKMLTFIPIEDIESMEKWEGSRLNSAKELLAHEVTKLVHGKQEADRALEAARAIFSEGKDSENMPSTKITTDRIAEGINIADLLVYTGLAPSKGEAKRLIAQGGIMLDDEKVTDILYTAQASHFEKGYVILKKGKKIFHKVLV